MRDLAPPLQQTGRTHVLFKGRKLSYFAGCDYFRLSSHPAVLAAVEQGTRLYGLNTSASRKTTGNHELYHRLEKAIAKFFGAEAAVLLSTGYVTNMAVTQAFDGKFTHAIYDIQSHVCLWDARPFLHAGLWPFKHRNVADLRRRIDACGPRARILLMTDGLFASGGAIAPLREYLEVLPRDAWLLVDDAHGGGVLGRTGKGTLEFEGVRRDRIVQTVTLSKAFGVYGGAVVGSHAVCEAVMDKSRVFVGNTPLPLPLANAALTAIDILAKDKSLRQRLVANTAQVKSALRQSGWLMPDNPSPIVSILPRSRESTAVLKRALLKAGIYPSYIHYPGGPALGHFRFIISSEHTPAQLDALITTLVAHWQKQER
ncbi:MAG: pyridoxal phosphate-dependent aminotransferase family protein [Verrucomicrobiota bacterium]